MKSSLLLVTVPTQEKAEDIADALLEKRLIACANIIDGVKSKYLWKGKREESQELLLLLKTRTTLVPRIISAIKEMHSYECPEILVFPIEDGNPEYLGWIYEETKD